MRRIVLSIAVCLLLAGEACADGKLFSAANDVWQPDQKGLLWHQDGRETLLLQVKYDGAAGDFGWVVPVPSRPRLDTASPEIFYELADLTKPAYVTPWWAKYRGETMGGIGGVSVVEEAQVGPYDATVLAATRAGALATWLKERGYEMPPGAARVLKSYVDRGWYYVALRVNAQRVYDQLLTDLQQLDPGIESLEAAPYRLADGILKLSDENPGDGERHLQAMIETLATYPAPQLGLFGRDEQTLKRLLDAYRSYQEVRGRLLGQEIGTEFASCLRSTTGISEQALADAFNEVVPGSTGSAEDPLEVYNAQVRRDLLQGVSWSDSVAASVTSHLAQSDATVSRAVGTSVPRMYDGFARLVSAQFVVPPLSWDGIRDLESDSDISDLPASSWRGSMIELLQTRQFLHSDLVQEVAFRADGVEAALSFGSIAPLRLEFDCDELVYPLYITSLNGSPVDVQIYVLSDHRTEAVGFETTYAGRLDITALGKAPETAKLVASGRDYLTEFRAKLKPEQMTADLLFTRSQTDTPYREEVIVGGGVNPLLVGLGLALLFIAVVAAMMRFSRPKRPAAGGPN